MDFEEGTRLAYDRLSVTHLAESSSAPEDRPIDRALFQAFADTVLREPGPVADVGCGAGVITRLLNDLGVDAFGVDLSPGMLAAARRAHPQLRFEQGSMLRLDLPDASLAGLLSCYSLIHVPWPERPRALAEFRRVLRPGGVLMLTFQIGDAAYRPSIVDDMGLKVTWYRQQPDDLVELLAAAGFALTFRGERAPAGTESTPQGYLLATRQPQQHEGGGLEED
ncbi:class I SAM-dependent methyltransferase [Dactylosporangium sp. CA-139066]|uniref:class I SAM-dependent methyltransferase n=1 Tax=Dactylosporangium sp. CA-139066 TaxID=3239930 RepID=UPI003D89FB24